MKKAIAFFLVVSLCLVSLQAKSFSAADTEVFYDSSIKGKLTLHQYRVPVDQKKSGTPRIYVVSKPHDNNSLVISWIRDDIKIEATLKTNGNKPAKNKGFAFISAQEATFAVYKADKAITVTYMKPNGHKNVKWTELKKEAYTLDAKKANAYLAPGLKLLGICIDLFHQKQLAKIMVFDAQLVRASKFEFDRDFGFSLNK